MKHLTHTLAFVSTVTILVAVPPVASATIVHAVPIVINVCGQDGVARVFTLTERAGRFVQISDSGTAVLSVDDRTPPHSANGRFRRLSGHELLRGERGTLTLTWTGQWSEDPHGRRLLGTWTVTGGTGAYAGFRGLGEFVSNGVRGRHRYQGTLITAV
jgi:hypothetical protein